MYTNQCVCIVVSLEFYTGLFTKDQNTGSYWKTLVLIVKNLV